MKKMQKLLGTNIVDKKAWNVLFSWCLIVKLVLSCSFASVGTFKMLIDKGIVVC